MNDIQKPWFWFFLTVTLLLAEGCALQVDNSTKKLSQSALIVTPPSHYSTPKGRYLGERYRQNLDRLVETILRDPKTGSLQFANNIVSSGGIGFFTHSAAKVSDERFLEVVVGTAETFDSRGEYSAKIARIFSVYGRDLLRILSSDIEIFEEKELAGYGLNFTWRTVLPAASGSRLGTERAIVYFPKEKVRSYVRESMSENTLLAEAVIFAVDQEGPAKLVSFRAQELKPDFRPPIREQVLSSKPSGANPEMNLVTELLPAGTEARKTEPNVKENGVGKNENPAAVKGPVIGESQDSQAPSPILTKPFRVTGPVKRTGELDRIQTVRGGKTPGSASAHKPEASRWSPSGSMPPSAEKVTIPAAVGVPPPQPIQQPQKWLESTAKPDAAGPLDRQEKSPQVPGLTRDLKEKDEMVPKPDARALKETATSLGTASSDLQRSIGNNEKLSATKGAEMLIPAPDESLDQKVEVRVTDVASRRAKTDSKPVSSEPRTATVVALAKPHLHDQKNSKEELALLREKPLEGSPENRSNGRAVPKPLEGYIIQLGFTDGPEARRWADRFQQRGYAVSVTEAGSGALRVRFGNFRAREDAEAQLQSLKQDGLTGIILNLPQAYQPETRSSLP